MKKIEINIYACIDENEIDIDDIKQTLQGDLYQICENYEIKIIDIVE